jgi:hypothetical protein
LTANLGPLGPLSILASQRPSSRLRPEYVEIHAALVIVFVTRDDKTIIKHRDKIEKRFPVKIKTPVEMVSELKSLGQLPRDAGL